MTHHQAVASRLRLRRAQVDDCTAIRRLLVALGYEAGGGTELPELLRAALARPDFAIFLALDQDDPLSTPLGLIQLSQRPQLHLGGTLVSIDALTVLPEARGIGVGRRLLRRARPPRQRHHQDDEGQRPRLRRTAQDPGGDRHRYQDDEVAEGGGQRAE